MKDYSEEHKQIDYLFQIEAGKITDIDEGSFIYALLMTDLRILKESRHQDLAANIIKQLLKERSPAEISKAFHENYDFFFKILQIEQASDRLRELPKIIKLLYGQLSIINDVEDAYHNVESVNAFIRKYNIKFPKGVLNSL